METNTDESNDTIQTSKKAVQEQKSSAQEPRPATPVVQEPKPAKPVAQEPKPAKPVAQEPKPAKPVAQEPKPAKPVVQESKPAVQVPKKTVQQPKKAVTMNTKKNTKSDDDDSFLTRMRAMSRIWKFASCSFLLGFLFHVIAYATPHWLEFSDAAGDVIGMGLWSNCATLSSCKFRGLESHCLNTLRGFGGVAVLLCLLVCPLLLTYVNRPPKRRCVAITAITVVSITAICIQIVTASFARTSGCSDVSVASGGSWSWSLALSVVSILFLSASAVLFFVEELRVCSAYRKGQHWRRALGPGIRVT